MVTLGPMDAKSVTRQILGYSYILFSTQLWILGPCLTENDTTMPNYVQNLELKDCILRCYFCFINVPGDIFKMKCLLNTQICQQLWDQCHTVRSCVHLRHLSWNMDDDDSDDRELDVDNRNCNTNMYCLIHKKITTQAELNELTQDFNLSFNQAELICFRL